MRTRPTVNVIVPDARYGLHHSARIVADALTAGGFRARIFHGRYRAGLFVRYRNALMRRWRRCYDFPACAPFLRRDLNIFLERIHPELFKLARRQVLIPNQEWSAEHNLPCLPQIDLVIGKTRHAEEIYAQLGCRTAFSSFTSPDRRRPNEEPKRREFLLLAGSLPGIAERVLGLWRRHPEWPVLTVSSQHLPDDAPPPNVRLIREFVPAEEVARLQNTHWFHLCATVAEGFGHKLNEAMACGAVAIATDGPPMNELIRPERGFLVKWERSAPKGLGTEYHFAEDDLERTVQDCLRLAPDQLHRLAANARDWFEQNDRFFRRALPAIIRDAFVSGELQP